MFLVKIAAELGKPLCLIFCKSLDNGLLPVDWKVGNVILVFKKGDRHSLIDPSALPMSLDNLV